MCRTASLGPTHHALSCILPMMLQLLLQDGGGGATAVDGAQQLTGCCQQNCILLCSRQDCSGSAAKLRSIHITHAAQHQAPHQFIQLHNRQQQQLLCHNLSSQQAAGATSRYWWQTALIVGDSIGVAAADPHESLHDFRVFWC